jgi:hypothetical protein
MVDDEVPVSSSVTTYEPEKSFFHDIGSMIFGEASEQPTSDRVIAKIFGIN